MMKATRFLRAVTTVATLMSSASGFLLPSVATERGMPALNMARAADICPEVPLTPKPNTEIVLVALG